MQGIVEQLRQQRRRILAGEQADQPGMVTAMVDVALISLYNRLANTVALGVQEVREQAAVAATGRLGRRHLGPWSELELLFIQREGSKLAEADLVGGLVEPLGAAGWQVRYHLTRPQLCAEQACMDWQWLARVADSRLLSGSRMLYRQTHGLVRGAVESGRARSAVTQMLAAWKQSSPEAEDGADQLEPDLELRSGGLADAARIGWASYLLHGDQGLSAGLDAGDKAVLEAAVQFFLRLQAGLHLLKGKVHNRLRYEDQEALAAKLQYQAAGDFLPVELMMRDLERHCYQVRLLAERQRQLLQARIQAETETAERRDLDQGFYLQGGRLEIHQPPAGAGAGELVLECFARAAELQAAVGMSVLKWARANRQAVAALEDAGALKTWLWRILGAEGPDISTLRALYDSGVLKALIPEMERVHGLVQHDAFHLYPVHEHHLRTCAELIRLLRGEYNDNFPEVREWLPAEGDGEILLLAGLLHDIGKAGGHGHARRGAEMVAAIGARLGLESEQIDLLTFVVGNHVLLTDTASRRDLSDQELIRNGAQTIGTIRRLNLLMLHSFADMRATGPRAWEMWETAPVLELYQCLRHHLEKGDPDEEAVQRRLQRLYEQLGRELAAEFSLTELHQHLDQLEPRYLLAMTPGEIQSHLRLERQLQDKKIAWEVKRKPEGWEVTLVSHQPLGLLWRVAGILTLHGMDIRQAQTYTKQNGVALQIFEVAGSEDEVEWTEVMADLEKCIQGKLALDYRLARQGKVAAVGAAVPQRPDEVVVDNRSSTSYTIIEVYTSDRRGLLYAITRALRDLQLQVFVAKISTRMDQVADIFYVKTLDGNRIEDQEQIEEIRQALLHSVR